MKIGVDISSITPTKAGIGYYTFSTVQGLLKEDLNNHYILFTNDLKHTIGLNLSNNAEFREIKSHRGGFFWIYNVSRILNKENFDLFISPTNFIFTLLFHKTIQIVHDLAPIKYPQFFSKKSSFMFKLLLNLMKNKVYKIGVPCQTIMDELIETIKIDEAKVFITAEGLHEWTRINPSEQLNAKLKSKYNLPNKYFLTVGTLEPRKNHINMIKAFNLFLEKNPDFEYIIVGKKGWFYEEIFENVKELNLQNKVRFLGYIEEVELPGLFDLSSGFLYCSFYEGFGIPCIEAYSRGLPVITSDIPVFHEILKDLANYANPHSLESIKNQLFKIKDGKKHTPQTIFIEKFSWEKVAKNIINNF